MLLIIHYQVMISNAFRISERELQVHELTYKSLYLEVNIYFLKTKICCETHCLFKKEYGNYFVLNQKKTNFEYIISLYGVCFRF